MAMATVAYKQGAILEGSWTALRLRRLKEWALGLGLGLKLTNGPPNRLPGKLRVRNRGFLEGIIPTGTAQEKFGGFRIAYVSYLGAFCCAPEAWREEY